MRSHPTIPFYPVLLSHSWFFPSLCPPLIPPSASRNESCVIFPSTHTSVAVTSQPVGDLRSGFPTDSWWWVSYPAHGADALLGYPGARGQGRSLCGWLGYLASLSWHSVCLLLWGWANEPLITHPNRHISHCWLCLEGDHLLHLPVLLQESVRRKTTALPPSAAACKEQGRPAHAKHLAADSGHLSALSCPTPSQ